LPEISDVKYGWPWACTILLAATALANTGKLGIVGIE